MSTSTVPTPGSDEAVRRGCTCPVMDNARGKGWLDGTFWISGSCQLHAALSKVSPQKAGNEGEVK